MSPPAHLRIDRPVAEARKNGLVISPPNSMTSERTLRAEVWIAVPRGARVPRISAPPLRVVNASTTAFDLGIKEHRIEGQTVRIYGLARTVADCFRFRNKIGLDVALEALTDPWRSKRLNIDELNRIAKKLRVQRVMQPYLETVVL